MKPVYVFLIISGMLCGCKTKPQEKKEVRAVWLHQTLFDRDEATAKKQIVDLFDDYAGIGINNLFCYYTLKEENNLSWDYLQFITAEGHRRGIGIHPIFCPGHEINLEKEQKEHPRWLIRDMEGKVYPNLNLALPEVREYWLQKIVEALKYDIDGIHLDYIRFPVNQRFSYDSITCAMFKNKFGYTPVEVSHDGGSMIWCEWIKWNEEQVTAMVREAHDLIRKSGKNVKLGADVFPSPEESIVEIAQNWAQWSHEGIIDFVCPMLYTNNTDLFEKYVKKASQLAGSGCEVYPGIGIFTSHNKITKEILLQEIRIARKSGAQGVVFFSGNSFNKEFRDTLRTTVFK